MKFPSPTGCAYVPPARPIVKQRSLTRRIETTVPVIRIEEIVARLHFLGDNPEVSVYRGVLVLWDGCAARVFTFIDGLSEPERKGLLWVVQHEGELFYQKEPRTQHLCSGYVVSNGVDPGDGEDYWEAIDVDR